MPILPAGADMFPDDLRDGAGADLVRSPRWSCLHTEPRQEKANARDLRAARIPFDRPMVVLEGRTPAGR